MLLNVFRGLPMLSVQLTLQWGKQKSRTELSRDSQEAKGPPECCSVPRSWYRRRQCNWWHCHGLEFDRDFDVSPHKRDREFQSLEHLQMVKG